VKIVRPALLLLLSLCAVWGAARVGAPMLSGDGGASIFQAKAAGGMRAPDVRRYLPVLR